MNADLSKENLRARLKKEIIQNNIYGVDIEEGAIEIARLRFWLSLVIELDTPEPLPNFDFKFMQGNSLLESVMLPGTNKPFNLNIKEMLKGKFLFPHLKNAIKNLYDELNRFYSETDHIKKQASRKAIKGYVIDVLNACVDYEPSKMKAISAIAAKTKDDFTCTDFFLWHTWFADVFDNSGFDIVIGNPPYIRLGGELNKTYAPYKYVEPKPSKNKKKATADESTVFKFKTYDGNGDIYCLFYEWGRELLKENGHLCYITSNKWMRAGYGEGLRGFLATETNPMILIDFNGIKIFENAEVNVNILLFEKTDKNMGQTWCTDGGSGAEAVAAYQKENGIKNAKDISITDKFQYFLTDYMYRDATVLKFDNSKTWVISSSSVFEQIKTKIENVGTALGDKRWNISINYGIKTGFNDAFIINTAKRDEILANTADYVQGQALEDYDPKGEYARTAALIRPILRGRDIKRYRYEWAGLWLIATVPSRHYYIEQYPAVKQYLLSFGKERLEQTGETHNINGQKIKSRKKTNNDWFETQDPIAYINDFNLPKIMYSEIVKEPQFYYDPNGSFYPEATTFIMSGAHLDYLYRLFHTHAVTYFFKTYYAGGGLNSDGYRYKKTFLINLPIPLFTNTPLQQKIVNTPTANTQQIDALVYLLYDITTYDELLEIEDNPSAALQMLILIHIHQYPTDTEVQVIAAIQNTIASLNNPNITVSHADIKDTIVALVNEKVILQNNLPTPTLSWRK